MAGRFRLVSGLVLLVAGGAFLLSTSLGAPALLQVITALLATIAALFVVFVKGPAPGKKTDTGPDASQASKASAVSPAILTDHDDPGAGDAGFTDGGFTDGGSSAGGADGGGGGGGV